MNIAKNIWRLFIECERMKLMGAIKDYDVHSEETNFRVNEEGELESDMIITTKVQPILTPKIIDVNFKVIPSNGKEK